MQNTNERTYLDTFAELTLDYKSGRRHYFQTTVGKAQRLVESAINGKKVRWVKIVMPSQDDTKQIIWIYEPITKWTRREVDLPRTNN